MKYIGIHKTTHDANLSFIDENNSLIHLEAERFSKVKHEGNINVIRPDYVYDYKINTIDHRNVNNNIDDINFDFNQFKINGNNALIEHHLAHASYSYYTRPDNMKESDIFVYDGWGLYTDQCFFNKDLERVNNSILGLGLLWDMVAYYLFNNFYYSGKVMGLSAYGKFNNKISDLYFEVLSSYIQLNNINKNNLSNVRNDTSNFYKKRMSKFFRDNDFKFEDYAFTLQKLSEKVVLSYLSKHKTSNNLCISGGIGLNGYINQKIIETGLYKNVHIPPATNDAGLSIGAVLYLYNKIEKKPLEINNIAYLGNNYIVNETLINDIINNL